ncbi:hypothetical protein CCYA_CCYA17G4317 [Cyanidiococcus yangmingshanensis]|nr:hypothetical protein CCYA_CCYA17G4317 [Cyanidiococcus yangmingshanensis]
MNRELPASMVLDFFRLIAQLKGLQRTGWLRSNVSNPESVASHSYSVALLTLLLSDFDLHAVKLALVHDLAESLTGDISPKCGVSPQEKAALEDGAFRQIRDEVLGGTEIGHRLYALFREYEDAQTPAALLVRQIDKLDLILQAFTYEQSQTKLELTEFFAAAENIHSTSLRSVYEEVLRQRRR